MVTFTRTHVGQGAGAEAPKTDLLGRLEESFGPAHLRQALAPAPEILNRQAVAVLVEARTLPFRGRLYDVPPVSFMDGFALDLIMANVASIRPEGAPEDWQPTTEALAAMAGETRALVAVFRRLVRPRGWRRLLWPVLPNPFRAASLEEVRELTDFFFACRTSAGGRPARPAGRPARSTSPTST